MLPLPSVPYEKIHLERGVAARYPNVDLTFGDTALRSLPIGDCCLPIGDTAFTNCLAFRLLRVLDNIPKGRFVPASRLCARVHARGGQRRNLLGVPELAARERGCVRPKQGTATFTKQVLSVDPHLGSEKGSLWRECCSVQCVQTAPHPGSIDSSLDWSNQDAVCTCLRKL
jgi:hypothetical protein